MPPRVLLLLPTTTYKTHDFMEAARHLDVEVVVGSDQRQILEEAAPGRTVTLTLLDPDKAADQIVSFAEEFPLAAVIPTDEPTVEVAALAARRLGLPHNPPEAARATRYKDVLRQILRDAGVRTPAFHLVAADEDPARAARRAAYPCVLKPTFLSASRGVIRADDPAEFVKALSRIHLLYADPDVAARGGPAVRNVLVERFVPGLEVALEGLFVRGKLKVLALFDKPDPLDGPYFDETIYVTPSRHPEAVQRAVTDVVARGAAALGLVEGPVHAEVRYNEQGAWLIEIAARSIGGLCSRALRFRTGISLEELVLHHAVGDSIEYLEREILPAGVMMLPVPQAGMLREIAGLDEARAVPGIVEVTPSIPPGQMILPLPEGSRYLGFLFARADTPAAVERALREAFRKLEIRIDPAPAGAGGLATAPL